jgi:hypothetical protein
VCLGQSTRQPQLTAHPQWLAQARAVLAGEDSGYTVVQVLLALVVPLSVPPELALDYLTLALGRPLEDAAGAASSSASALDLHQPLCTPAQVSLALLQLHGDESGRRSSSSVGAAASLLLECDSRGLPDLEAITRIYDASAWTAVLRVAGSCARMCAEALVAQEHAAASLTAGWLTAGVPALVESARAAPQAGGVDEQSVRAVEAAFATLFAALDSHTNPLISSETARSVLDSLLHGTRPRRGSTAAAAAHAQDKGLVEQERALRAASAALPPLQTWRLEVWDIGHLQLPGSAEPSPSVEIVHLLHLFVSVAWVRGVLLGSPELISSFQVDEQLPWAAKVEAARTTLSALTDAAVSPASSIQKRESDMMSGNRTPAPARRASTRHSTSPSFSLPSHLSRTCCLRRRRSDRWSRLGGVTRPMLLCGALLSVAW